MACLTYNESIDDFPPLVQGVFPVDILGPPSRPSYRYGVDAGVIRTPFESGVSRQRRRYLNNPSQYSLSWSLTTAQVSYFAAFADRYGYTWFKLAIPTIQTKGGDEFVSEVDIRFITDYRVSAAGFDWYRVETAGEVASTKSQFDDLLRMYWSNDAREFYHPDDV